MQIPIDPLLIPIVNGLCPLWALLCNPSIGLLYLCGSRGGDTHDIAAPTYKTFNLPARLSTYLQDINPTAN